MNRASRSDTLRELKERLIQMALSRRKAGIFSTGIAALDWLLPRKGLAGGTLMEWLHEDAGAGAGTLALIVAGQVLQQGGAFVVMDGKREFYPPAAASLGIPLEHTVVIQPENTRDPVWALEQALRSSAVAVALGWFGRLDSCIFRRLQLAAEAGGGLGFLLRPLACQREPSWADARLLVKPLPQSGPLQSFGRRLHVEMLHCRGGFGGEVVELELSDEAGHVRVASQLAHPTPAKHAAGA